MKISVGVRDADEELLLKHREITLAGKRVETPTKSINKALAAEGFNEIFKNIDLKKIHKIKSDASEEQKFNKGILSSCSNESLNFAFISYSDEKIPNSEDMEVIADVQYAYSDAAIVPLCPRIISKNTGENLFCKFTDFVQEYLRIAETLNNKSVLGLIPTKLPRQYVPRVLDIYYTHDITSFVLDSDGSALYSNLSWLKSLQRKLYDLDILEEGFLYNINSGEGKFLKNADTVLAKDFIAITMGIDVIGTNHIPPPVSTEGWMKIKQSRNHGPRLFDPTTYGYIRKPDISLPDAKKINIVRKYNETQQVKQILHEHNTVVDYIREKEQIAANDVITKGAEIRKFVLSPGRQKSLFDK
ncbi:MAG: hypothetical protein PWR21_2047 [Methanoculleus sp.]|nr:hypothetical protein [Methanoculleus sp.]